MTVIWILVSVGLASRVLRGVFAGIVAPERLPGWFASSLDDAAPAVIAALVAGAVFGATGFSGVLPLSPLFVSSVVGALVAWRTGGLGRTIISAVVVYALIERLW